MRPLSTSIASLVSVLTVALAACGLENLANDGSGGAGGASDAGDAGQDAGITGAGCGAEHDTGITLCAATSLCPKVVVDTQAFPSCGFRIRGGTVDLVCACNEQICAMGVFTTCEQAAQLLTSQTQQAVCTQVSEGRCTPATSGSTSSSSSSSSSSTSSSSSSSSGSTSSGGTGCDKQCLSDCGGGAACASVCNCS